MSLSRLLTLTPFCAGLTLLGACGGAPRTLADPAVQASAAGRTSTDQGAPPAVATPDGAFLVKPYLQLGDAPAVGAAERMTLLWHAGDEDAPWSVEVRPAATQAAGQTAGDGGWRKADAPAMRRVAVPGIEPHRVWSATLTGLAPGTEFDYRVLKAGKPVFAARARARKGPGQPYRFVVFGDCAAGTDDQKAVAYQTYLAKPDFVFITGDIVYSNGRISEYRTKYFPVYNADQPSADAGAPLLRSTLFVAAPGNHDILNRDLDKFPDGLAYFLYWSQPRNGPLTGVGAPSTPTLSGAEASQKAFLQAAGSSYPRTANFSFDYAGAHWTVLDANPYVDWTDPALRAWVEKDLAAAKNATWRFVGFHHPGFNSSKTHFNYQKMRLLSDVFEKGKVDLVFTGHVHNYQRTFPLHFAAKKGENGKWEDEQNRVAGDWTLDKTFDGKEKTRPAGVIYLVTGAGGARLYNPEQQADPASWQEFTHKYVAETHSLTVVDVDGKTLKVRQISDAGKELDRFTVTK